MIIVSDTSILSGLVRIGEIQILQKLFGRVIITEEVASECSHPLAPSILREILSGPSDWLAVEKCEIPYLPETRVLDQGEASAITLASTLSDCLLLIDEQAGRKIARQLGIPITGLIGLIGKAAELGHLNFDSAVRDLRKTGFRISEDVIRSVHRHLLEPVFLKQIPDDFVSYLKSDPTRILQMDEGDAEFLAFEDLELEWSAEEAATAAEALILRDAHGNELHSGDTVQLTKDLKVKGTSTTLKIGTKVKNIRINPGADHDIDCKVDGIGPMKLKSQFVKRI